MHGRPRLVELAVEFGLRDIGCRVQVNQIAGRSVSLVSAPTSLLVSPIRQLHHKVVVEHLGDCFAVVTTDAGDAIVA